MDVNQRLKDFLEWWGQGLLLLLPKRWLARLRYQPDTVTVEQRDDTLIFRRYAGTDRELSAERTVSMEDEPGKVDVKHWLNEQADSLKLILLLPRENQLQKRLTYPIIAEKELRAVLDLEMDKQTPFSSDKVYFDYIITGRDMVNGQLHITLCLVLREVLHERLDTLGFLDQQPAVATTGSDVSFENINFMPPPDGNATGSSGRPLGYLCLAVFVLFMTVLYLPLLRYNAIIEQSETRVGQARAHAVQAQALGDKKQAALERVNFLADRDRQQIPFIRYIDELTRRLPDNTWINRLVIRDGEMQLQGESSAATSMIQILEESDYFEHARFRSPVTKNNATGKEEFHVVSKINSMGLK